MKVINTALDGVLIIEPSVFPDNRGFFMETYNRDRYKAEGITTIQKKLMGAWKGCERNR